jgi:excisionase family DNA binding protein
MTIKEIMERLAIGRDSVYAMLRTGQLPAIRVGGRGQWLVTRHAFETWEKTNGMRTGTAGSAGTERDAETAPIA